MDWIVRWKLQWEVLKKYRYILILLVLGIALMFIPEEKTEPAPELTPDISKPELQEVLSEALSKVSGAGSVQVLLTQEIGEEMIYQTDGDIYGENRRQETVLVTQAGKEETGLIRRINLPVYRGAVILCQGADNAQVRLQLCQAVASATGLSLDKISILKMK